MSCLQERYPDVFCEFKRGAFTAKKTGRRVSSSTRIPGCDTVSFFSNRGTKSACQAWQAYPEAIDAFHALSSTPSDVPKTVIETLERFVVVMYDRTSELKGVHAARRYLFSKKSREIENIPPTAAALLEHTKTAAFQAGYIWGQCLVPKPYGFLDPENVRVATEITFLSS